MNLEIFYTLYLIAGLFWVLIEHKMFQTYFKENKLNSFDVMQLIIHYLRVLIAWPTYAMEDLLMTLESLCNSEDDN